jgi:hypothetical protein
MVARRQLLLVQFARKLECLSVNVGTYHSCDTRPLFISTHDLFNSTNKPDVQVNVTEIVINQKKLYTVVVLDMRNVT